MCSICSYMAQVSPIWNPVIGRHREKGKLPLALSGRID
jgi:hypothetical protein